MGHDLKVDAEILDILPTLSPDGIHEWVDKSLLPPSHPLVAGVPAGDAVLEALRSPKRSAMFPLDEEFFDIFWKSVCLKMCRYCGCNRCGALAKANNEESTEDLASETSSITELESKPLDEGIALGFQITSTTSKEN